MHAIILGGIGMTARHVKSTASVYQQLGMTIAFYEATGLYGNHLCRPHKFTDRSVNIINDIGNNDYVLHCFSGSNWLGYDIHSKLPANAIVLESSPLTPSDKSFQNYMRVTLGVRIPLPMIRLGLNAIGIPTLDNNEAWGEAWKTWYKENKPSKNVLILTGKKDKLLDHTYIEEEYISEDSNNKVITFQNAGHCNLAKQNLELYQRTLKEFLSTT